VKAQKIEHPTQQGMCTQAWTTSQVWLELHNGTKPPLYTYKHNHDYMQSADGYI